MKHASLLPVDANGNPIPVFIPDTKKTQAIALTSAGTVYSSTALAASAKTLAKLVIGCSGDDTITFTAVEENYLSEEISIATADGGTFGIAISGRAITITPAAAGTACSVIKAAIEANPKLSALVTVSYTSAAATIDASQAAAFLSGWDDGETPVVCQVCMTGEGFIGTFSETKTATKTASMYVPEGQIIWLLVLPGEIITAKAVGASKVCYITPAKRF